MARIRKPQPTVENLFFATPEQKVIRFLLSEPTTTFTPRVISSKLKGVRGLGGTEGIMRILNDLATLGMVDFVDNKRAVRLRDDCPSVSTLKTFVSVCDLDGLKKQLTPLSAKGVLYGARARGSSSTDSTYELLVVSRSPEEVRRIAGKHPLGKAIELETVTPETFDHIENRNPSLAREVTRGIVLWGPS